jgi:hypothetical protein
LGPQKAKPRKGESKKLRLLCKESTIQNKWAILLKSVKMPTHPTPSQHLIFSLVIPSNSFQTKKDLCLNIWVKGNQARRSLRIAVFAWPKTVF